MVDFLGQSTGWVGTNPTVVFWYQWDYLRSPAKNLLLFCRISKIGHVFQQAMFACWMVQKSGAEDIRQFHDGLIAKLLPKLNEGFIGENMGKIVENCPKMRF